jgi:hypothetical protein
MPRTLLRTGAVLASALLLLAPAIWNRFPLLEYDTGGYLARWFEHWLVPSRSPVYGLLLTLLARPDFWPVVIVQSLLTVWMLALLLRALGLGGRPLLLLALTLVLAVFTTLPWLAGMLLTDIFAALAVIAVYLLVYADAELRHWERHALLLLVAFAVATHSATFALVMELVAAAAVGRRLLHVGSTGGVVRGAVALGLGALMLMTANLTAAGRFAWTPGGVSLQFGRLLQDGVVDRYLAEHCRETHFKLCAHRAELPRDADAFFWSGDDSVFNRLGRFKGMGDEMAAIVAGSLRAYPAWQAELAAVAAARQLIKVSTGEGVLDSTWHTHWAIAAFAPHAAADMLAARQQRGELSFDLINRVHRPIALGSMLLVVVIALAGRRRESLAGISTFAATTALALLGNAVVCGVFSNPHDRYGARLVWLAPLVVALALWQFYEARDQVRTAQLGPKRVAPG